MTRDEIFDYIRVVNIKGEEGYRAEKDETVIPIHRINKVLGNPFPMQNQTMKERERVIDAYKKLLDEDLKIKGPMWQALNDIAVRVANKEKIALSCFCVPLKCHGHLLVSVIMDMVYEMTNQLENKTNNIKCKM